MAVYVLIPTINRGWRGFWFELPEAVVVDYTKAEVKNDHGDI